MNVKQFHIFLK